MTLQPTPFLYFIWLLGILGKAVLLAVVVGRRRYRTLPVFSSYAAFIVAKALALFWFSFHDERGAYFYAYYILAVIESLWTIAVVLEIFDQVFSRRRIVRAGLMRGFLVVYAFTAIFMVSLAAFNIRAYPLLVMALANTAERVAVFVAFGSFAATAFFSSYLKIPWKPHVFGVGAGFLLYLSVNAAFTAVLAMHGRTAAGILRYLPMLAILLAELVWIRNLRKDEPELRPVAQDVLHELRAFLARAEMGAPEVLSNQRHTLM